MLSQYMRERGRQEGSYKTIVSLVRNAKQNGLSDEMIARIANLTTTQVKKILNNESVDISCGIRTKRHPCQAIS